jgi:hypothetical protein
LGIRLFEILGIWEFVNSGIWEFGILEFGIWEFGIYGNLF